MSLKWGSNELWAVLRPEIQWIAADQRGKWGYGCEPVKKEIPGIGGMSWCSQEPCYALNGIAMHDIPEDCGDSLRQRPREWKEPDASTPIDAPVWVRLQSGWFRRHYAGNGTFFGDGYTSWTLQQFYNPLGGLPILLPDPNNPDRKPPVDWDAPDARP